MVEKASADEPPVGAAPECWRSKWSWSRLDVLPELRGREGCCPALEAGGTFDAEDVRALEKSCAGLELMLGAMQMELE